MATDPLKSIKYTYPLIKVIILVLPFVLLAINANGQGQAAGTQNTGVQEDVNEFLGYEDLLLVRYISLPYDTVMNTNVASYFVDLGFLLIIFLPLIYLVSSRISWLNRLGFMLICAVFLCLSVPSAYLNKHQIGIENASATLAGESASVTFANAPLVSVAYQLKKPFFNLYNGIYHSLAAISGPRDGITYLLLLLLLIPAFLLLDQRIRHHDTGTRTSIHFLLIFSFLWLILSSGITWYGMLMIPLLFLFTVLGMSKTTDDRSRQKSILKGLLFGGAGVWLLLAFSYRFANYDTSSPEAAKYMFMATMSEYQAGRKDMDNIFDRTFPQYRTALEFINQEDNSYIYRVGTLMPFFISKNDQRIVSDNFLDFFNNLNQEFPNKVELARALKAYGFRYIILDLNLHANDHTETGSLRNKFQQFNNFLYQNPHIQLLATDRILRAGDGSSSFGVFREDGMSVENWGWFAVFQII